MRSVVDRKSPPQACGNGQTWLGPPLLQATILRFRPHSWPPRIREDRRPVRVRLARLGTPSKWIFRAKPPPAAYFRRTARGERCRAPRLDRPSRAIAERPITGFVLSWPRQLQARAARRCRQDWSQQCRRAGRRVAGTCGFGAAREGQRIALTLEQAACAVGSVSRPIEAKKSARAGRAGGRGESRSRRRSHCQLGAQLPGADRGNVIQFTHSDLQTWRAGVSPP